MDWQSLKQRKQRERFEEIDILKAIAIILMVGAHAGAPFTGFAFLFHMAAFFMASGFCFRQKSSDSIRSVKDTVFRKLKTLWFPFFVWNTVFVLLRNVLIRINIYTDNPGIEQFGGHMTGAYTAVDMLRRIGAGALFSYKEEIIGAMWFLKILFLLSVTFCVADFLIRRVVCRRQAAGEDKSLFSARKRLICHGFLSIVLLALGYWGSVRDQQLFGVSYVASYYILFFGGHLLSLARDKYRNWPWHIWLGILILSYGTLKMLQPLGGIGLNQNKYGTPWFLLGTSLSGWFFLYSCSVLLWKLFSKLPKNLSFLKSGMIQIGRRTLPVVIFHFLAFKLVAEGIILAKGLPAYCLASFPSLYGAEYWLIYTVVGTGVPILMQGLFQVLKEKLHLQKRKEA